MNLAAQARSEGVERLSAGVIVTDAEGRVLMLRRRADDVLPGLWDYPGGALLDGEDPRQGGVRELAEETGITGAQLEYVRALDFTSASGLRTRQFVFTATVPAEIPVTVSEHDVYTWAVPGDLPPTSDGYREVLDYLHSRRALPGWRPVGQHIREIGLFNSYAGLFITDSAGRVLCLRSAQNPDLWQLPGGDLDPGETPWTTALRETLEETGLDLMVEAPEAAARRQLLAVISVGASAAWPLQKSGHIFWGGELTDAQLARIQLSSEHTEWACRTVHDWGRIMPASGYRRLLMLDRARRAGITLYSERPAGEHADGLDEGLDQNGVQRDFEGIVVFVTSPDGKRLLLNHRDDVPGIAWPNMWTPIGGHREGRETAYETAAREVLEEAGVQIRDLRLIPGPRHPTTHETSVPLHAIYDGPDSDLVLGEGQAIAMVPIDQLHTLDTPPYMDHYLQLIGR